MLNPVWIIELSGFSNNKSLNTQIVTQIIEVKTSALFACVRVYSYHCVVEIRTCLLSTCDYCLLHIMTTLIRVQVVVRIGFPLKSLTLVLLSHLKINMREGLIY